MADQQLAIIVLAAGQGTRMRSAVPKLLHPLAGRPILSHVLATAGALQAQHVLVVVRHERDRLAEVIAVDAPDAVIVDQDDCPGTGRAVERAVAVLPVAFAGDVLVLNGDVPLLDAATLSDFIQEHRASNRAATVLTTHPDDPTGYGRVIRDADGLVARIVEHRDATDAERAIGEVNTGVYAFGVAALRDRLSTLSTTNAQGERYLTDLIQVLRDTGCDISAVPLSQPWLAAGINDRAQLAEVAGRLNALIVRGWQLNGVTVQDPATTWIDLTVRLAPDVTLLPGTQLQGATTVASGARIGPDTTLVDCEVGADAHIRRSEATLAVIGAGAEVGPFAYLRVGTVLGTDGKIGAFVETKHATIGRGTKVPHLSYVGDAEVGEGSNIGAGTIVANYDGINKHHTVIGSRVRVGANNVLVAPVRVGDGAYTAAGTVVRRDVTPGALALNVAPQRELADWVATHRPGTPTHPAPPSDAAGSADSATPAPTTTDTDAD